MMLMGLCMEGRIIKHLWSSDKIVMSQFSAIHSYIACLDTSLIIASHHRMLEVSIYIYSLPFLRPFLAVCKSLQ